MHATITSTQFITTENYFTSAQSAKQNSSDETNHFSAKDHPNKKHLNDK